LRYARAKSPSSIPGGKGGKRGHSTFSEEIPGTGISAPSCGLTADGRRKAVANAERRSFAICDFRFSIERHKGGPKPKVQGLRSTARASVTQSLSYPVTPALSLRSLRLCGEKLVHHRIHQNIDPQPKRILRPIFPRVRIRRARPGVDHPVSAVNDAQLVLQRHALERRLR